MTDTTTEQPGTSLERFDPSTSAYPILFAQDGEGGLAEVIEDNFGDEGFSVGDLDRITVPAGGGLAWTIPDEDPKKALEGVVVHKQPTRSFWFRGRGEDGEEDTPPDCYSADAKLGVGAFGPGSESNPTGECGECPMNVFGSSDRGSGNGKACKEQMQLFILQEGSILPVQLSLPPTSLKGFRKYMTRLASKGKSYYAVVTSLGLKVEKGGGQTYSVVEPGKVRDLVPQEAAAARGYGQTIRTYLEQAAQAREAAKANEAAAEAGATKPLEDISRSDAPAGAKA